MPNNEYMIKLVSSPFQPPIETAGDLVVKLSVPYSSDKVTIEVNPNVRDYNEKDDKPSVKVRQVTVTTKTEDTRTLQFDFIKNKIKTCEVCGKNYEFELVDIGKITQEGQAFPTFSFLIREQ